MNNNILEALNDIKSMQKKQFNSIFGILKIQSNQQDEMINLLKEQIELQKELLEVFKYKKSDKKIFNTDDSAIELLHKQDEILKRYKY
jgi:hypothetical protein